MSIDRSHWLDHIKRVVRSRHYTWLPEGLGGEDVKTAMTYLAADIMHVCALSGVDWATIFKQAQQQFENEELSARGTPTH